MQTASATRARQLAAGPLEGRGLERDQALELLRLADTDLWSVLYEANLIRRRHCGDLIQLCGIVAAKVGRCSEDCQWCSQSARHSTGIEPHGLLDEQELLAAARRGRECGAYCFGFVSSGAAPTPREIEQLCRVVSEVDREGLARSCLSLGLLDEATARRLAAAGCRRYNHNLETSRRYYPQVVTTHRYEQRVATARAVKAAGMELCSGGLFGLGEGPEDRVDLALAVREMGADVVPLNFLNPIPGTPLADLPRLSPRQCLAIIAMVRFVLPKANIKVSGGREVNLRDMQSWMFYAGADGCVVGNYLTTTGRAVEDDLRMISDLGLEVASGCSRPQNAPVSSSVS
jgi:biotin synthase